MVPALVTHSRIKVAQSFFVAGEYTSGIRIKNLQDMSRSVRTLYQGWASTQWFSFGTKWLVFFSLAHKTPPLIGFWPLGALLGSLACESLYSFCLFHKPLAFYIYIYFFLLFLFFILTFVLTRQVLPRYPVAYRSVTSDFGKPLKQNFGTKTIRQFERSSTRFSVVMFISFVPSSDVQISSLPIHNCRGYLLILTSDQNYLE